MAVVQSDSMKIRGCDFSVFFHVSPQIWTVLRAAAVAQLHTVTPADELSAQVHIGTCTYSKSEMLWSSFICVKGGNVGWVATS